MPKLLLQILALVVFLVLVIGGGGAWLVRMLGDEVGSVVSMQEQDDRQVAVPGVKRLRVRGKQADVRVYADSGTVAQVTAVRVGAAKNTEEALQRARAITWTAEVAGDTLVVEGKVPEGPGLAEVGTALKGGAYQLGLAIYVPKGTAVDVEVGVGDLWCGRATAPVRLASGTGAVEAVDVRADVAVATATGDVTVTGGRGKTLATAGTGNVAVGHRPGPALEMRTGTGDLDWAFPYEAPATNRLEAGTGDITLSVGTNANVALELEAQTGAIDNRTKLPGTVRANEAGSGARASLTAGTGKARLGARTGTGNVLVEGPRGPEAPEPSARGVEVVSPPPSGTP